MVKSGASKVCHPDTGVPDRFLFTVLQSRREATGPFIAFSKMWYSQRECYMNSLSFLTRWKMGICCLDICHESPKLTQDAKWLNISQKRRIGDTGEGSGNFTHSLQVFEFWENCHPEYGFNHKLSQTDIPSFPYLSYFKWNPPFSHCTRCRIPSLQTRCFQVWDLCESAGCRAELRKNGRRHSNQLCSYSYRLVIQSWSLIGI